MENENGATSELVATAAEIRAAHAAVQRCASDALAHATRDGGNRATPKTSDNRKSTATAVRSTEVLRRTTFRTSRLLDFASEKELVAQTGHQRDAWALVVLKELVDNAIDACEEAGTAPVVAVTVNETGIAVTDNGPGLPTETLKDVLDFQVRVSSREAYVSPTRGAQGNALKTIVAMPFVLDGAHGRVEIETNDSRHIINFAVDRIRQEPVITHKVAAAPVRIGTLVRVRWPDSARSNLEAEKGRFLQIATDYGWINPHLTISVNWFGEQIMVEATDPSWAKWMPSDPTSPHWYTPDRLERLGKLCITLHVRAMV